ncbi:NAD(P)-dependent dehydrogenase, short-chain alcohol dehydrogenase family [Microbacterium sp. ru370.1]|uniref:SDR family NAD(P)-dependent oxidoreductase n=1 Tax=unclassified Microbacterium TaxID=2609290 RepID=UPI00088E5E99|nr:MULTISPECIES: SDR family oxidoreductase [unclassified Microbacterium]SDO48999.1 NAD(P)-dependent dehydrogenase, short-chain alcohol dehydrogenase family [Microbacterium sp. ru370.1]SIT82600.1 NAD(P)-dependent dehydrogenase, short-chain alcohol dehydrogenase family [Microbacterium sp. RU1D]
MTGGPLDGLVAVVTGAGSGIGLATAELLRDRGAEVWCLDAAEGDAAPGIHRLRCDVRDGASVAAAVAQVAASRGRIDVLVNNAGISAVGTVEAFDDAEWARVLDVNVVGMARMSAACLPWLRRSEHAAIVNVCSIAALNGLPERALYSASKGAVYALTLAMATDHVREGIRVNAVSPGTVETPFVTRMLQGFADPVSERRALEARQATRRLVQPDEVARAVAYLVDPDATSTTGTILDVDGGVTRLRVRAEA